MAQVIQGGGISFDQGAGMRQNAQVNQGTADLMRQKQAQYFNEGMQLWNTIQQMPGFQSDPDLFVQSNPEAISKVTELFSLGTGRKLTGEQAFDMANKFVQFSAQNPDPSAIDQRAYRQQQLNTVNGIPGQTQSAKSTFAPTGMASLQKPQGTPSAETQGTQAQASTPTGFQWNPQVPKNTMTGQVSVGPGVDPTVGARNPLAPNGGLYPGAKTLSAPSGDFDEFSRIKTGGMWTRLGKGKEIADQAKVFTDAAYSPDELRRMALAYATPRAIGQAPNYILALAALDAAKAKEAQPTASFEQPYTPSSQITRNSRKAVSGSRPSIRATGTPGGGNQLSPKELNRYEQQTGDIHRPALIGDKEGVVNARAMMAGGSEIVRKLNEMFPATEGGAATKPGKGNYAGGFSPNQQAVEGSSYTEYAARQAQIQAQNDARAAWGAWMDSRGIPSSDAPLDSVMAQQPNLGEFRSEAAAVQPNSDIANVQILGARGRVNEGAAPNIPPSEDYQLAPEGPDVQARMAQDFQTQAKARDQLIQAEALSKYTTPSAQAAAQMATATPGFVGKARLAQIPKDLGAGIESLIQSMGVPVSATYRDKAMANRDASYMGKYTREEFAKLPPEQVNAIVEALDQQMQARSPEFMAAAGGRKSETISQRRSETEARKLALVQAKVELLKSSNKSMADVLGPISSAISQYGNLYQISQAEARALKKPTAQYFKEEGQAQLAQLNTYGGLIETFAKSMGVDMNLKMALGDEKFGLFGLGKRTVTVPEGTAGPGLGGTLSEADAQAMKSILSDYQ